MLYPLNHVPLSFKYIIAHLIKFHYLILVNLDRAVFSSVQEITLASNSESQGYFMLICGWGDSNSQGLSHTHLKRARIPIPPHPLVEFLFEVRFTCFVKIPRLKGGVNRGGDGRWEMGDGSWEMGVGGCLIQNPKSKIIRSPISPLPSPTF
jgi:hypothetical protein